MGILKQNLLVSDKRPVANSDHADLMNRADLSQSIMGGSFDANNENGKMGTPTASPQRINQRINGKLVSG